MVSWLQYSIARWQPIIPNTNLLQLLWGILWTLYQVWERLLTSTEKLQNKPAFFLILPNTQEFVLLNPWKRELIEKKGVNWSYHCSNDTFNSSFRGWCKAFWGKFKKHRYFGINEFFPSIQTLNVYLCGVLQHMQGSLFAVFLFFVANYFSRKWGLFMTFLI